MAVVKLALVLQIEKLNASLFSPQGYSSSVAGSSSVNVPASPGASGSAEPASYQPVGGSTSPSGSGTGPAAYGEFFVYFFRVF